MTDIDAITAVSANRGITWLLDGFDYFRKDWLAWIGVLIIFFIITLVASLIPVVNLLFNIVVPIFFGGLMIGCRDQDQGASFNIAHLFAGFSNNPGQYLLLGLLYFVGIIIVGVLTIILMIVMLGGMEFITELQSGDIDALIANSVNILLAVLIGLLFYLPLLMAIWFAPALIALENQSVLDAMRNSFRGCLVNVMPFLLYGLIGLVFSILATIPLMLGWLVLTPMIIASIYIAYRDIFKTNPS